MEAGLVFLFSKQAKSEADILAIQKPITRIHEVTNRNS